ncbi:hypothetical protein EMMF5_005245, partial [Cystobasidiomycetes sp. EMM_F5]
MASKKQVILGTPVPERPGKPRFVGPPTSTPPAAPLRAGSLPTRRITSLAITGSQIPILSPTPIASTSASTSEVLTSDTSSLDQTFADQTALLQPTISSASSSSSESTVPPRISRKEEKKPEVLPPALDIVTGLPSNQFQLLESRLGAKSPTMSEPALASTDLPHRRPVVMEDRDLRTQVRRLGEHTNLLVETSRYQVLKFEELAKYWSEERQQMAKIFDSFMDVAKQVLVAAGTKDDQLAHATAAMMDATDMIYSLRDTALVAETSSEAVPVVPSVLAPPPPLVPTSSPLVARRGILEVPHRTARVPTTEATDVFYVNGEPVVTNVKANRPKAADLPTFDGSDDANHQDWFVSIDTRILYGNVPDGWIVGLLPELLSGKALSWYETRIRDPYVPTSWQDWKQEIVNTFETPYWRRDQRDKLANYWFPDDEKDPAAFCNEFFKLSRTVDPNRPIEDILYNLLEQVPGSIATMLEPLVPGIKTLTEFASLFKRSTRHEGRKPSERRETRSAKPKPSSSSRNKRPSSPTRVSGTTRYNSTTTTTTTKERADPVVRRDVSSRPMMSQNERDRLRRENLCFECKQPGHTRAECPRRGIHALETTTEDEQDENYEESEKDPEEYEEVTNHNHEPYSINAVKTLDTDDNNSMYPPVGAWNE